ncbi:MAG: DUF4335 domain-containing protein [Phormidium sp. GEM2.Bin31]|nr:MAG: DUF4335 domain-containing protein [Phormidium sp. GEM2.Bin31]
MAEGHWSGQIWSTRLERSYTPPTCRLTVVGRRSLLSSRQRPRLSNLRFELVLDDPRLPNDDQKVVSGDQAQLFHLSQLVRRYVQGFLSQSAQHLEALAAPPESFYGGGVKRRAIAKGAGSTIAALSQPRAATYMEPQGLAAHNLVLGTLATPDSGAVIRLGTLQLFDVLSALESFLADWESWVGVHPEGDGLPAWLSPLVGVVATGGLVVALAPLAENPPSQDPSPPSATLESWDSLTGVFGQTALGSLAAQSLAQPETLPTPPPPAIVELPPLSRSSAPPPERVTPLDIAPPAQTSLPISPPSSSETPAASSPLPGSSDPPDLLFEQPLSGPEAAPWIDFSEVPEPEPFAPLTRPVPVGDDQETVFDGVPQVTEVRRYFQQRWTPPEGLNQTLEYTLVLDESGTLTRVSPLGRAAVQFQEHSQIPELGQSLASPHDSPLRLRLVLGQDGDVKVFGQ